MRYTFSKLSSPQTFLSECLLMLISSSMLDRYQKYNLFQKKILSSLILDTTHRNKMKKYTYQKRSSLLCLFFLWHWRWYVIEDRSEIVNRKFDIVKPATGKYLPVRNVYFALGNMRLLASAFDRNDDYLNMDPNTQLRRVSVGDGILLRTEQPTSAGVKVFLIFKHSCKGALQTNGYSCRPGEGERWRRHSSRWQKGPTDNRNRKHRGKRYCTIRNISFASNDYSTPS